MTKLLWLLLTFAVIICKLKFSQTTGMELKTPNRINYLEPGELYNFTTDKQYRSFFDNDLRIYCYRGQSKTLKRLFESLELRLYIVGDDYIQYDGATPLEVEQHYKERRSLFSFTLFSQKRARLPLSPFKSNCLGIDTVLPYKIGLQRIRIDFWRALQLICGCFIFHYAGKLSENSIFYYITGVILGICSSFMFLIWVTSKLLPKRPLMYGALIGGWAIGIYVVQLIWENLQVILVTYKSYVFWYIFITGLISFFFCYRWGPPSNKRSRTIIKWLLQLMSLAFIYLSSHHDEATAAVIIIMILVHYFPRAIWYTCRSIYLRKFPPKRRLLSTEEYYEEGVRETTKALEELRKYATSPECKQWRMMTKLRDPFRFAAFIEGASHLRDDEILHFESSKYADGINIDDSTDISVDESDDNDSIQKSSSGRIHQNPSYLNYNKNRNNHDYNTNKGHLEQELSEDEEDEEDIHGGGDNNFINQTDSSVTSISKTGTSSISTLIKHRNSLHDNHTPMRRHNISNTTTNRLNSSLSSQPSTSAATIASHHYLTNPDIRNASLHNNTNYP